MGLLGSIGKIFGGGGSNNSTQTMEQRMNPTAQRLYNQYASRAEQLSNQPYAPYSGQRFAPFSTDQNNAFNMARTAAQNGIGDISAARGNLNKTLQGGFFNQNFGVNPLLGINNPYLQQAINYAHGDVSREFDNRINPSTDATFARSGAFGGSAWRQAQAENERMRAHELGRISSGMRMQDYGTQQQLYENALNRSQHGFESERGRQMQAAAMAPQLSQAEFARAQAQMGFGDVQRQHQQAMLDQMYNDWLEQRQYPERQLGLLGNGISLGNGSSSSTATGPSQKGSPLAGAVGGALAGSNFGPWGAAIGGGLGLLSGM